MDIFTSGYCGAEDNLNHIKSDGIFLEYNM